MATFQNDFVLKAYIKIPGWIDDICFNYQRFVGEFVYTNPNNLPYFVNVKSNSYKE